MGSGKKGLSKMNAENHPEKYRTAFKDCNFEVKNRKELDTKNITIEKSLEWILTGYERFKILHELVPMIYDTSLELAGNMPYRKEAISIFCKEFKHVDSHEPDIGLYISALINAAIGKDDIITLEPAFPMHNIGYNHSKGTLLIKGDLGDFLGYHTSGGKIEVFGNTGSVAAGKMADGNITVHGNVEGFAGLGMSGGSLVIGGNAKNDTASQMSGGSILVCRDTGKLTAEKMYGGLLHIMGSAGSYTAAEMFNGEVIIEKDSRDNTGWRMSGGKVSIRGSAGNFTGHHMTGGKIIVEGKIESVYTYSTGGEIWESGKRFYPK